MKKAVYKGECYECGEDMFTQKEECIFCDGTGKKGNGSDCSLCDEENEITTVFCYTKGCIFDINCDDDEEEENTNE